MFSKTETMKYIEDYSDKLNKIAEKIKNSEAIIIGIGAGMSTSAGLSYSGERFMKYFSDFHNKYGINDMYSGGFYPFETSEEYWAWWSRHVFYNRYDVGAGQAYKDLLDIVKDRNYFVITTNVDHQLQKAGFDKKKLYYTQGDYGLFQCSVPCHDKTYGNEEIIRKMIRKQENTKIPTSLIPHCPICDKEMTMNLRKDEKFVQDEGWYKANKNYAEFLKKYKDKKTVFLELGIGNNTPGIIKYPFWQMTYQNKNADYITVNLNDIAYPEPIKNQTVFIEDDISKVLKDIRDIL